ncbi:IS30 family transposase [Saccharopolyspora indica]|uniref:IS30 family transposase n=1 Tax=Saccharopolyspora indica TaxID=1229659 RepID=UPI003567D60B
MSSLEACRIVGINPRTGRRWRNGRAASGGEKAASPITAVAPPSGPSRYLTEDERIQIADLMREKASLRAISRRLGRSPSTISREIRRNRHPGYGGYRPHAAHARALARRPRPKPSKIGQHRQLREVIQDLLKLKWSPEQICRALRTRFPGQSELHVVHETIYQELYRGHGALTRVLRSGRTRRRPRRHAYKRRPRAIPNMTMISDRPAEADDRTIAGHWEGDLIIGKGSKSAIGTLVERTSRYTLLVHLPAGYSARETRTALIQTVQDLPQHMRKSLTWDQGSEMAAHQAFTRATGMPVYFCNPGSPWQRGSNENTNGLLRQYFPKSTDLAVHDRERLDAVAAELNNRPRKTLGWDTPAERFATLLTTTS